MNERDAAIEIVEAELTCPEHEEAIGALLDAYSCDEMGNGRPLDAEVRARLIPVLRENPTTVVLLAYAGTRPVGIATCFRGVSTFAARPLLNLHDLAVIPEFRGRGVGRMLLTAVEEKAAALGCCKVTLEVLEGNPARAIYEACGYRPPVYQPAAGRTLFLTKPL